MLTLQFGEILTILNISKIIVGIISACIYPLLTFYGLKILIERLVKVPLHTLRFRKFKINQTGIIIGVLLPAVVVISYLLMQGEWKTSETSAIRKIEIAVTGICFYSISAGIAEEMVFRGVIMGLLEKWKNIKIAINNILLGII